VVGTVEAVDCCELMKEKKEKTLEIYILEIDHVSQAEITSLE